MCYTFFVMKLIKLWKANIQKAYELHNALPKYENGFENPAFGFSFEAFTEYVAVREKQSRGIDLPEGRVPDTVFILADDDGNYVGRFNLRHYLNAFLENGAGHIGFGIHPAYRRKGYATAGLALCLKEARKLEITEAYLSCHKDNPASLKAQLKNGARIHHEDDTNYYTRITLSD